MLPIQKSKVRWKAPNEVKSGLLYRSDEQTRVSSYNSKGLTSPHDWVLLEYL